MSLDNYLKYVSRTLKQPKQVFMRCLCQCESDPLSAVVVGQNAVVPCQPQQQQQHQGGGADKRWERQRCEIRYFHILGLYTCLSNNIYCTLIYSQSLLPVLWRPFTSVHIRIVQHILDFVQTTSQPSSSPLPLAKSNSVPAP